MTTAAALRPPLASPGVGRCGPEPVSADRPCRVRTVGWDRDGDQLCLHLQHAGGTEVVRVTPSSCGRVALGKVTGPCDAGSADADLANRQARLLVRSLTRAGVRTSLVVRTGRCPAFWLRLETAGDRAVELDIDLVDAVWLLRFGRVEVRLTADSHGAAHDRPALQDDPLRRKP